MYANKKSLQGAPWYYSTEDADRVLKDAVTKGRSIPDENFPDDPEKTLCLVRQTVAFEDRNKFEEELGATATVSMDSGMASALLGADGILQPSGVPDVYGLSEASMAAFAVENCHGVEAAKGGKPKAKAKAKAKATSAGGAAVVTPTEVIAHAKAMQQEFLDEATQAGKFATTITTYSLSSEMSKELKQHSKVLLKFYRKIGGLIASGVNDNDTYEEQVYSVTRPLQEWYVSRAPAAKSLCKSMSKGAKKVSKKEDKEEAEAAGETKVPQTIHWRCTTGKDVERSHATWCCCTRE